jgi:hypothetical protein
MGRDRRDLVTVRVRAAGVRGMLRDGMAVAG